MTASPPEAQGSSSATDSPRFGTAALYAERAERHRKQAAVLGLRSRRVSNLRGLAFGTAAVCTLFATLGGNGPSGPVAVVAAVLFVVLVVWHARVIEAEDAELRQSRVNLDAEARRTNLWKALPGDGARFASDTHSYSSDLDIFGPGSLYQRISVAHTRYGEEALARFLSDPAPPETIRLRQGAAQVLAPRVDDRQTLEALSIAVVEPLPGTDRDLRAQVQRKKTEPPNPEPLLKWAEGAPWLSPRRALVALAYFLPVATLTLALGAHFFGWSGAAWVLPFAGELYVLTAIRAEADRVFAAVSSTRGAFLRYGPMFELIERLDSSSALLGELKSGLLSSALRPSDAMKRFERIVGWFDLRHNGMIHPFANAFLLWDAHCLLRLEAWQRETGPHVRAWFVSLGEVEALSSFAGLAFDEPSFAWPEIAPGPACFEARGLGHPLVSDAERVTNDVAILEPGRAMLITGSNMSGKSTLMRSMGIAAVLGLSGGPVCAARLRLSPLAVCTSIKISDSLARGVSHFYAEVARLKAVVDATAGPLPVFFLLDEILHGTNSEERQIGARWVLAELVRRGAIGAVSTHDVGLCQLPDELMTRVEQCHFRESVEDGKMTFDYRLRPGPVRGGNALRLMRLVGLPVPIDRVEE
ncbi:MAG TPA: DNA mismatch repair protein MutS [Polyangiaceae bacterium]